MAVIAPHLLTGLFASSTALLANCCALLLLGALWTTRHEPEQAGEPLVLAGVVILVCTVLHALPLPDGLAQTLAPTSRAWSLELAQALDLPRPTWFPFSPAASSTWERILYSAAVLSAFAAARVLALRGRASSRLLTWVGLSSAGVALSHLAHRSFGAHSVYGVFTPRYLPPSGPLLNDNNLAGMLALGLPICAALVVRHRSAKRWLWVALAACIAATGILAGSRGGLLVLVGGPTLFALLHWRGRARGRTDNEYGRGASPPVRSATQVLALLGSLAILSFGLAALTGSDTVDTNYGDLTKLNMYGRELGLLLAEWRTVLLGAGRGAFRTVFSSAVGGHMRATHAENIVLQYALEFGVPLALASACVVGVRLGGTMLGRLTTVQAGGAAGLVALLAQNLVDFGIELTGIAIPAAVCFGALPLPRTERANLRRCAWTAGAISIACSALVAIPASHYEPLAIERALEARASARDSPSFWREFQQAVRFNPGEPALWLLAGHMKMLEGAVDGAYWFNRTMELAPGWAMPHLQAANWLAARGRWDQAADELNAAAVRDPRLFEAQICAWMNARPRADFASQMVPSGALRANMLDRASACLTQTAPTESATLDERLLREEPRSPNAKLRMAKRALEQEDYADAIVLAREVRKESNLISVSAATEAEALVRWGQPQRAVMLLKAEELRADDRGLVLRSLAAAQSAAGDADGMRRTIEQLRLTVAGRPLQLAEVAIALAQNEDTLRNDARAMAAMLDAYRISGLPQHLDVAAIYAWRLGQSDFAIRSWGELCERYPEQTRYCTSAQNARRSLLESR